MSRTNIEYFDTPYGKEAQCKTCGSSVMWEDCPYCDEGYSHHDCGEDTCCCLMPLPNVKCDICNGEGGWFTCLYCNSSEDKEKTQ